MPCTPFRTANGATGFVCSSRPRFKPCACGSGLKADLLCDWKTPERVAGTCDAKICRRCAHVPAPGKDLCPDHGAVWTARLSARESTNGRSY